MASRMSPSSPFTRLIFLLAVCISVPASAQQTGDPPLISDRPDFTESPVIVPVGSVQLEAGLTRESSDGNGLLSVGEALLRIPVADRLEARLGFPTLNMNGDSRFSDSSIGAKFELDSGNRAWRTGLIGTLSLPTGQSPFSSGSIDPSLILATGGPASRSISVGTQIMAALPTVDDSRQFTSGATIVGSTPLSPEVGAFIELAGEFPELADAHVLAHAGATVAVGALLQFDVHIGHELTDQGTGLFVGAGFVYRR